MIISNLQNVPDSEKLEKYLKEVCTGKYHNFRAYLKENKITHLDLSNRGLKKDWLKAENISSLFSALEGTDVTSLNLAYIKIGAEGAEIIAKARKFRNSAVTSINFSSTKLGDKGVQILIKQLPINTITINFADNDITDEGAEVIAREMQLRSAVTSLILANNLITSKGAIAISKMLHKRSDDMEIIDLSKNNLEGEGALAILTALVSKVKILNLSNIGIDDQNVKTFKRINAKVDQLDLSKNEIGDLGAYYIAKMIDIDSLVSFDLSENRIGNRGAHVIAAKFPSTLQTLNFSNNLIGDAGALAIYMNIPSGLTALNLRSNGITREGIQSIKLLFPKKAIKNQYLGDNLDTDHKDTDFVEVAHGKQKLLSTRKNLNTGGRGQRPLRFTIMNNRQSPPANTPNEQTNNSEDEITKGLSNLHLKRRKK